MVGLCLVENKTNRSISLDDSTNWDWGSPLPPSFQGKCATVALPLVVDTPITRVLAWSCPHGIPCSLGLDQLASVVILYFCPPTAYMSLFCKQRGFFGHPLQISNIFKYWAYAARALAPVVTGTHTELATVASEQNRSSKAHSTMDTNEGYKHSHGDRPKYPLQSRSHRSHQCNHNVNNVTAFILPTPQYSPVQSGPNTTKVLQVAKCTQMALSWPDLIRIE